MTNPEATIRAAVENAEEVRNLLDGLVERVAADPKTVLQPDVAAQLAVLKEQDPSAFEALRDDLKKNKVRMSALDEAVHAAGADGGGGSDKTGRRQTQADILIGLASQAELFHTPNKTGYASFEVGDHREVCPITSNGFRRWLTRRYFEEIGKAPNAQALKSALNVLDAKAHFDGSERDVHLRVGSLDGRHYLDLVDREWQAVEFDCDGWRVVKTPPISFRRTAGMLPLPIPEPGGSIDDLRPFLNVHTENDFVLAVSWMLASLLDRGPYPVLLLVGEQGSAKSTFAATVRKPIDPNTSPLRALPRKDRDLFIAANNGHVLCFDNVSKLSDWISDTLCRLATGGGFAVRQLYTDQDEVLFDATRPSILNGIEDVVTRPDLAERALLLTLDAIPENRRRTEADLSAALDRVLPRILGVLLDALVHGLRRLPTVQLESLPRMADFALLATACETAFWPEGTFVLAYAANREEGIDRVIESDPVAAAIRSLFGDGDEWSGTATDLLAHLNQQVPEGVRGGRTWPTTARALAGRLRRAATFLRGIGIDVTFAQEGHGRDRIIAISAPASSAPCPNGDIPPSLDCPPQEEPPLTAPADDADGADGLITPLSEDWGEP